MENVKELMGKKYIVTGASSGIGRETCKNLARLGATVILVARDKVRLEESMQELVGKEHRCYSFDLREVEKIERLIELIVEENGKLDGFVHCAGMAPTRPLKNTKYEFVQEVFQINTFAFIELLRVFSLKKYNVGCGAVVGFSSAQSVVSSKGLAAYSAAKAGMDAIVRVAAKELFEKKIRVNSLRPAWVKTQIMIDYLEEAENSNQIKEDVAKALEPSEVAEVVSFLLSDASSGINGRSIMMGQIPLLSDYMYG